MSSDQYPPQPPAGSSGPPPPDGTEPSSGAAGYPPTSGSGSIYESASYHPPAGEMPPAAEMPHEAMTPPVAGGPPPGYAPPAGYAPPPAYAAAPAQGKNNTQLFGILGIVFAVVCCPLLGVLFGWLSMNEAKKTGSDDTLGKVGFWLGIAFVAIWLVTVIIGVCAGGLSGWNTWD